MFDKEEITDFANQEETNVKWIVFDYVVMFVPVIYFIFSIFMWR